MDIIVHSKLIGARVKCNGRPYTVIAVYTNDVGLLCFALDDHSTHEILLTSVNNCFMMTELIGA
jgi:hypothetical protein